MDIFTEYNTSFYIEFLELPVLRYFVNIASAKIKKKKIKRPSKVKNYVKETKTTKFFIGNDCIFCKVP